MATEVLMPRMGFDMTEGTIERWLKKEGDEVKRGEVIAEIQTDKVNIEIEAFDSGILSKIIAQPGQKVPVGGTIAIISAPGEKVEERAPAAAAPPGTPGEAMRQPLMTRPPQVNGRSQERIKASPVAKRLAQERGIDLSQVTGTGPGGRITRDDVEAFRPTPRAVPPTPPPRPAPAVPPRPAAPPAVPAPMPGVQVQPHSRMRQAIGRAMTTSKQQVPHFYVTVEIDMGEALKLRNMLNERLEEDARISINDLVVKATALALRKFPALNAYYTEQGLELHDQVNMSIAVAVENGLITPVLHDVAGKSLGEIARRTRDLIHRTKSGGLKAEELQGGTFTISNLGMYDVEEFIAIINPPQAAILAVGSVKRTPVVRGDEIAITDVIKVTISADHRVTDGAEAARFLGEVKRILQDPVNLLL